MGVKNSHQILCYVPELIWEVLQQGILFPSPGLSGSTYVRNLVIADLKHRNLLTPEMIDALITGEPLREPSR